MAVASDSAMTSIDGETWSQSAGGGNWTNPNRSWTGIAYGNGKWVGVSYDNSKLTRSSDGVSWTAFGVSRNNFSGVVWGDPAADGVGIWVAVTEMGNAGEASGQTIMTSTDTVTWTARLAPSTDRWKNVSYGNGLFVAVSSGTTIATSPDGITWTAQTVPSTSLSDVSYGNGLWVAVGYSNRVLTSSDGITWTSRSLTQTNGWRSVVYGNGVWVAVAYDGTDRVMTSPDGITWTSQGTFDYVTWNDVFYGGGKLVAVGSYNSVTAIQLVMTG